MNDLYDSGISRRHMVLVTGAREWIFIFLFFFFLFRFFVCLLHSTGSKLGRRLRNLSRHLSCMYIYIPFSYIYIYVYILFNYFSFFFFFVYHSRLKPRWGGLMNVYSIGGKKGDILCSLIQKSSREQLYSMRSVVQGQLRLD